MARDATVLLDSPNRRGVVIYVTTPAETALALLSGGSVRNATVALDAPQRRPAVAYAVDLLTLVITGGNCPPLPGFPTTGQRWFHENSG